MEEIKTNQFVYHMSHPRNRENISKNGLIPKDGEQRTGIGDKLAGKSAVFATDSIKKADLFDSTFDDDMWRIDTSKTDNKWYRDENFAWNKNNKHIVTFSPVPASCLKLLNKGSGDDTMMWAKDRKWRHLNQNDEL